MTTTIASNGSKWAGQEPDSIDTLLEVMKKHPLRREYSGFEEVDGRTVYFYGNFDTISHVFSIESDDAIVVARLVSAMERNWRKFGGIEDDPAKVQQRRL